MQRQIDRFKLSLAIVDVLGIIAFFWTSQWVILVYLTLFNFLIILIDVIRKGMVVRPVTDLGSQMPDELPVDPETGNLYRELAPKPIPKQPKQPITAVRNVPPSAPFARQAEKQENPFDVEEPKKIVGAGPKDHQREEIEEALSEWGR